MSLGEGLAELEAIGVRSDGVHRFAWSEEDRATREWFREQAVRAGLSYARDAAGNLWAHPGGPAPWWGVGSHLDSVRGGGRFDGPLGVAAGFAVAARKATGVAVLSLADEEGARFNTPTFGSKALTGALDVPAVLTRADESGITLAEAMRADGVDPDGLVGAPAWLDLLCGFVELHIDQSTDVAEAGQPIGIVSALAGRMRLEVTLTGQADHAGTTPPAQRRDALGTAARLIVSAEELGADRPGMRVTSSRILVEPNATTTIAAHVRLWIDARAPAAALVDDWLAAVRARSAELAERSHVQIAVTVASRSESRAFSEQMREALHHASVETLGHDVPEVICFAGHDAG
ncbi:MAG TPA: hydantoinase/carbamoylase family amidase, partial [Solirubrobacteraceae bacterium]|nr:hydantoinase/carbamoylase family amidase [Solirubrobacteraceae bacterium]